MDCARLGDFRAAKYSLNGNSVLQGAFWGPFLHRRDKRLGARFVNSLGRMAAFGWNLRKRADVGGRFHRRENSYLWHKMVKVGQPERGIRMCPVKPSGKRSAEKAKEAAGQWKDVPIRETHYMDAAKPKPDKRKPKQGPCKEDMDRFGDWATTKVPILPPDHPDVQAAIEWTGRFITPKEELDSWPDDPPTIENNLLS